MHGRSSARPKLDASDHGDQRSTPPPPRQSPTLVAKRPFASQQMVVVLGEAVGFVADVLQQPQGVRVAAQRSGSSRSMT